jgi:hypothetical protein
VPKPDLADPWAQGIQKQQTRLVVQSISPPSTGCQCPVQASGTQFLSSWSVQMLKSVGTQQCPSQFVSFESSAVTGWVPGAHTTFGNWVQTPPSSAH